MDCKIGELEFIKSFRGPREKTGSCTSQAHICMKKYPNGAVSLDSFFKASWLHA